MLLGISSCKPKEDPMLKLLQGRWEIREAYRSEQPTTSLAGLYFEFGAEGKLRTNLPVSETPEPATYSLSDGTIRQVQGEQEIDYQIEALNDTALVLNTNLQNFPFRFVLAKSADQ
jgi:hypothetical protein